MRTPQANEAERPSGPGKPAVDADPIPQRERQLYTQLAALCAERAHLEVAIPEGFDQSQRTLKSDHEEDLARIERTYRKEVDDARLEDMSRRSNIATRVDIARRVAEEQYAALRRRTVAAISAKEEAARRKRDEDVWNAHAVAEATRNQLTESHRESSKALETALQELQTTRSRALVVPGLFRLRAPSVRSPPDREVPDDLEAAMGCAVRESQDTLKRIEAKRVARVFQPHVLLLSVFGAVILGMILGDAVASPERFVKTTATSIVTVVAALSVLYLVVGSRVWPLLRKLKETGEYAHFLRDHVTDSLTTLRKQRIAEVTDKIKRVVEESDSKLAAALRKSGRDGKLRLQQIQEEHAADMSRLRMQHDADQRAVASRHSDTIGALKARRDEAVRAACASYDSISRENTTRFSSAWTALEERWRNGRDNVQAAVDEIHRQVGPLFPGWAATFWTDWSPPLEFAPLLRCGQFDIEVRELPGGIVEDERFIGSWPDSFCLPAVFQFPDDWSILLESDKQGRADAFRTLRLLIFRVLSRLPAGKARLTIVDPVGLGQPFAGFLHLADYEEALVTKKIWTEGRHIDARLTELTEHMERVIQKYFRSDADSIGAYNERAGELAEPYRFLVIADFPTNFSENAARRLASIIENGPRCGVFPWIYHEARKVIPAEVRLADIEEASTHLVFRDGKCTWKTDTLESLNLIVDAEPVESLRTKTLHTIGKAAKDANRVEVPFRVVEPEPQDFWSLSSIRELRVPLGRAGAGNLQHLTLGPGTSQHVLIAGKTGSGKSTLLHVLITNLAMWYSPDEVEFFLVDFKKGVEFRTYASHGLLHAKVVAIESDREYGLSVLRRMDRELRERGARFRDLGVQDIAGCRQRQKGAPTPRSLLVIDEFQELFVEDDTLSQEASLLLDRLVRQGRAFGIHVILGSQTLGGAYSLPRTTMGQMTLRIALQMNEADSQLIMDEDNSAPRLLSRPGEAIYNDQSGLVEGNSVFQIVWLGDEEHVRALDRIEKEASVRGYDRDEPQITFEGGRPVFIGDNLRLQDLLQCATWPERPVSSRAWIGEAVAIKDPTAMELRRQSGSNLLIVGQNEKLALSIVAASVLSLALQQRPGPPEDRATGARFYIFNGTISESPFTEYCEILEDVLPHFVAVVGWRDVPSAMVDLTAELTRRQREDLTSAPPVYTFVFGLQRFRDLRRSEDDFGFSVGDVDRVPTPSQQFIELLREGPPFGMHTGAWCDGLNSLNRVVERRTIREFENRVVFQMSVNDSTSLIDTAQGSRLGPERALLYSEETGLVEKFRPYVLPDLEWLETFRKRLQARNR